MLLKKLEKNHKAKLTRYLKRIKDAAEETESLEVEEFSEDSVKIEDKYHHELKVPLEELK